MDQSYLISRETLTTHVLQFGNNLDYDVLARYVVGFVFLVALHTMSFCAKNSDEIYAQL